MATLADELLNDFEDSSSDVDDRPQNDFFGDGETPRQLNGTTFANGRKYLSPGIERDDHGEDLEEVEGVLVAQKNMSGLEEAADQEETKAKVEKMKLGGVNDVRNVAGLMKTLQPVLEVRRIALNPLD